MANTIIDIKDNEELNSKEVCQRLGISRTTLSKYVNNNMIKFHIKKRNGRKAFKGIDVKLFWKSTI